MKNEQKKGFQLVEIDPINLDVHELAAINPMMPEDQYVEFKKQFENGFDRDISHVVLYKGKIVDGRHRCRACTELGIKVWARNLAGTKSMVEVEEFVEGTEARRHQTVTQRAIGAYKYYAQKSMEGEPVSQEEAATKRMSSRKLLSRAKELHQHIGDEILDRLHNGEKLLITNPQTGVPTTTDTLTTLINYFKNRNGDLTTKVGIGSITDQEKQLAQDKFDALELECNKLVMNHIGMLISYSNRMTK